MKDNNKKAGLMIAIIVLFCIVMAVIDGVFKADYFIKSVIKLILFLILPLVYSFYDKDIKLKENIYTQQKWYKNGNFVGNIDLYYYSRWIFTA